MTEKKKKGASTYLPRTFFFFFVQSKGRLDLELSLFFLSLEISMNRRQANQLIGVTSSLENMMHTLQPKKSMLSYSLPVYNSSREDIITMRIA